MASHDKIATRLAIILTKLNAAERFTVEELVEEFGVTKRTIQRDLNERLSYLPIKKENGYYFLESYYLGKLSYEDIQNFSALSGIKELFPSLKEDFLKAILDSTVSQAYLVKGHHYEDLSDKTVLFKQLEEAIVQTKQVGFNYKEKQRVVHPYKLLNTKGIWYLVGVEEGVLKTFSLSKLTNLRIEEMTFTADEAVREKIEKEENTWFGKKQSEVILKVDKAVAGYFTRRNILPNQTLVKELEDGGLLVSTKVTFNEEILKLVRYWIPHVTIVSPVALQNELEEGLRGYLHREVKV